jgi:hypothetical protein
MFFIWVEFQRAARPYISRGSTRHNHRYENLNSHIVTPVSSSTNIPNVLRYFLHGLDGSCLSNTIPSPIISWSTLSVFTSTFASNAGVYISYNALLFSCYFWYVVPCKCYSALHRCSDLFSLYEHANKLLHTFNLITSVDECFYCKSEYAQIFRRVLQPQIRPLVIESLLKPKEMCGPMKVMGNRNI